MIPVAEASARLLALVAPLPAEDVPLRRAGGRVLARDVAALRDQPPFDASAMDGYAVAGGGPSWRVVGEAAAGRGHRAALAPGEAVRIFTGAPIPAGADRVLIQEDAAREGCALRATEAPAPGAHVRPRGGDFARGDALAAPRRLAPAEVALCAAMGHGTVPVRRRAEVAIVMTGDELAPAGVPPGPDGIPASNGYGIAARLEAEGARVRLLPIAADRPEALAAALGHAAGADLILTVGGASVGDHDLVARVAGAEGLAPAFHKVAMRPGKPLLAGRLHGAAFVGLPGNPVSSLVCTEVFAVPMLRAMAGLPPGPETVPSRLAAPVGANGPRAHYMRATRGPGGVAPVASQDSSRLRLLAGADALIVRPPHDPARAAGATVETIPLR